MNWCDSDERQVYTPRHMPGGLTDCKYIKDHIIYDKTRQIPRIEMLSVSHSIHVTGEIWHGFLYLLVTSPGHASQRWWCFLKNGQATSAETHLLRWGRFQHLPNGSHCGPSAIYALQRIQNLCFVPNTITALRFDVVLNPDSEFCWALAIDISSHGQYRIQHVDSRPDPSSHSKLAFWPRARAKT